jgi:hypothetical protein
VSRSSLGRHAAPAAASPARWPKLAEAGATVGCTGRSVKGTPRRTADPRRWTETAAMIKAAGGQAIAMRVDHTSETQVKGFLQSETMLQHFGVTEENWRDTGKKDSNFLVSESPLFVGRAIAALAADPKVHSRTGMLVGSWELGRHYGWTDTTAGVPTGAGTRSTSRRCPRSESTSSARAPNWRLSG